MTYAVKVRVADVRILPVTSYGNDPAEAFQMEHSGKDHMILSTSSEDRFNQWLTALDNEGLHVDVDYEIVMTP